jgi:multiple antibiotic resistance protein
LTQYVQGVLTILSLVNPVICATIFSQVSDGQSRSVKVANATKAALAIMGILCLAALGGAQLLKTFGISLSAFQVAGGMVLVWMGFIMLRGSTSPTTSDSDTETTTLTPLILFAASPGTITGVITLAVAHSQHEFPITALVSVVVAITATWMVMILSARTSGGQKRGLVHDVTTRFMGLIVLAMGVQFVLTGLEQFFHSG